MKTVLATTLLACAGAANGQLICGFNDLGAFANVNGSGSVGWSNTSATIIGDDSGLGGINELCFVAPTAGTVCFDWIYNSSDSGCFDTGYVSVNGSVFTLACNTSAPIGGFTSFGVNAGDTVCMGVFSADGIFGPGILDVSNFAFKKIPAPGSLALLGAAGLLAVRRRR